MHRLHRSRWCILKITSEYHDLRASSHEFIIDAGEYLDRFDITFSIPQTLSNTDIFKDGFNIYYAMSRKKLVILNPEMIALKGLSLFDINGKEILYYDAWEGSYNEYPINQISSGVYIAKITTKNGFISKKFILK